MGIIAMHRLILDMLFLCLTVVRAFCEVECQHFSSFSRYRNALRHFWQTSFEQPMVLADVACHMSSSFGRTLFSPKVGPKQSGLGAAAPRALHAWNVKVNSETCLSKGA